jgi:hypothetical protein
MNSNEHLLKLVRERSLWMYSQKPIAPENMFSNNCICKFKVWT